LVISDDILDGDMSPGRWLLFSAACSATNVGLWAQSLDVPDWQRAAGGKMAFEVAAVRLATRPALSNFPLAGDVKPPGGRLFVALSLPIYIAFAYKLQPSEGYPAFAKLPRWATSDVYEINAKAEGNPTKDQMRLMMQSLLADRFKVKVHYESREGPALAMRLVRPGKLGPRLRPHSGGPPCPQPGFHAEGAKAALPLGCGGWRSGMWGAVSRDATLRSLADQLYASAYLTGDVDRPIVDETGLKGTFDFAVEWSPDPARNRLALPGRPGATAPAESQGSTFQEALREQLGIKLISIKVPVRRLVIDHIERPSAN
jgi:bla regulator protein blaR1